jgi:putative acetyltransferase
MAVIEPIEFTSKKGKRILVRSAEISDARATLEAMIEIAKTSEYVLQTSADFQKKTLEEQEAFIERAIKAPTSFFLLALHCGKVIGSCDFVNFKDSKRSHRGGLGISVDYDFRGEGIGEGMMKALIQSAKIFSQIKFIELDVMEPNTGTLKMYLKLGFKVLHTTPQAYQLSNGDLVANHMMRLEIQR